MSNAEPAHTPGGKSSMLETDDTRPTRLTVPNLDEVMRESGVAGAPWPALSHALSRTRVCPGDDRARLAAAVLFTELGLPTPAREQIDRLTECSARPDDLEALQRRIAALPDDRVSVEERRTSVSRALEALGDRGDVRALREVFDAWSERTAGYGWYRSSDGNVLRRRSGPEYLDGWQSLVDHAGEAARLDLPHARPGQTAGLTPKPYYVEGVDPPWLLRRLLESTPRQADGHQPRVTVLQADPYECLDGLAQSDLAPLLSEPRVRLLVGMDASRRLARDLCTDDWLDRQFAGPTITLPSTRTRLQPTPNQAVTEAASRQQAAVIRLAAQAREDYDRRDERVYAERYRGWRAPGDHPSLSAEPAAPLRVLIPTSRYSTFVRHSAADLAGAFERLGCVARVLVEPDDHSHLSAHAYARVIAEFRPDLVVLVNYTRANIGPVVPAKLPFICWIQDAMPHLFDEGVGTAQTRYDFIAGHAHLDLFERFGFPRERTLGLPVAASETKFHGVPAGRGLRERLACEVAFASHHGEPPDDLHRRCLEQARSSEQAVRIMRALRPRIEAAVECAAEANVHPAIRAAVVEAARAELGADPDARTGTRLLNQYAFPMADRLIRHRVLGWAADLCERRGWRLRVHGRGWEAGGRFARYACGELAHDDELRASYQAATVHLHASVHWMYHQRVMECALSGGLPAYYFKADDLTTLRLWMLASIAHDFGLDARAVGGGALERPALMDPPDHPAVMAVLTLYQRLGLPVSERYIQWPLDPALFVEPLRAWRWMPRAFDAVWLLGDPAETCFRTPTELERLIERAIESPPRREHLSRGIAGRVRAHYSSRATAEKMLRMVAASFTATT